MGVTIRHVSARAYIKYGIIAAVAGAIGVLCVGQPWLSWDFNMPRKSPGPMLLGVGFLAVPLIFAVFVANDLWFRAKLRTAARRSRGR